MKEIAGIFQAQTGFCIPQGKDKTALYPAGRHLRGAIGHIALALGLPVASRFPDLEWDGIIFRDLLPVSKCRALYPLFTGDGVTCPNCGEHYGIELIRECTCKKFKYKEMPEGRLYRLSIIVQDESFLSEAETILRFIDKNGVYFGKRTSSGTGRFVLQDFKVQSFTPYDISKGVLASDAITDDGSKSVTISRTLLSKDSFEQIELKARAKGGFIEEFKGIYIGRLGGLGFGEVLPRE